MQSLFSSARRRLKQWEPFLSICHISTLNILYLKVPVGHLAEVTNKYWIYIIPWDPKGNVFRTLLVIQVAQW